MHPASLEEKENVGRVGDQVSQKNGTVGRDGGRSPKSLEGASLPSQADSDMLGVPGGTFTMGLDHKRAIRDERTEHEVTLAPFLLDRTEVTNEAYIGCVDAGVCRKPKRADNSKNNFAPAPEFRVGAKGGISVYGLGRFPVTLVSTTFGRYRSDPLQHSTQEQSQIRPYPQSRPMHSSAFVFHSHSDQAHRTHQS